MCRWQLALCVLLCVVTTAPVIDAQTIALTVVSAKRAEKYSYFGSEVTPARKADVVLLIDVAGLTIEQFQKIQESRQESIYVTAGERKFIPNITTAGASQPVDANGKPTGPVREDRWIVVVVPRDLLDFTVHMRDSQAAVKASATIVASVP